MSNEATRLEEAKNVFDAGLITKDEYIEVVTGEAPVKKGRRTAVERAEADKAKVEARLEKLRSKEEAKLRARAIDRARKAIWLAIRELESHDEHNGCSTACVDLQCVESGLAAIRAELGE